MKLRTKTHLISVILIAAIGLLVVVSAHYIILEAFKKIEFKIIEQETAGAMDLITKEIDSLDSMTADWAYWDETYKYASAPDEGYVQRNLTVESLSTIDMEIFSIFNAQGREVISIGTDPRENKRVPVPKEWKEELLKHAEIFGPPNYLTPAKGILILPEYPVLFAARQILTSERKGPTHGTLIEARKIDSHRIETWDKILRGHLRIYVSGTKEAASGLKDAQWITVSNGRILIKPLNEEWIAGYGFIEDITGAKRLTIEVELKRDVYAQARHAIRYFTIATLFTGIVFWLVIAMLTDKVVLLRLLNLNREVNTIASSGGTDSRVEVKGSDEISHLGTSINTMLGALQKAEEQLKDLNARLIKADNAKTEFTSIVSHELRTPLSTIKQAIEIITEGIDGPITEKQAERLSIAKRNVDRLVRLTNDLLDFTRLETGRMEMHFDFADVSDMMTEVYYLMKPATDAKGIALELETPPYPKQIFCDADKIKQTMINLINNSTKFTEKGGNITLRGEGLQTGVRIEVEDTGKGIKKEDMTKVFQPFRQIVDGTSDSTKGSGLGLAICKMLVEKHGGTLTLDSTYGEGSTFMITLPNKPPDAA